MATMLRPAFRFTPPGTDPMPAEPAGDFIAAIQDNARTLPESGIVEVVNHAREREDLLPLWVGEGDLPTPEFISKAAVDALYAGETKYTYQRGVPVLRRAIADYLTRTYAVEVSPEWIYATVGGMQAIVQTVQMLIAPGDEAVVPMPCWPNVFNAVHIAGGRTKPVHMTFGNQGWTLDLEKLMDACGPKTRAIFVNSPSNPTGWVMEREEQQALLEFARERGIWLISDEVYGRIVYDRDVAPSFLQIMDPEDRVIVVNTFSKNWAMTGWRIGWVVANPALGQVYENLIQYNTSGVPSFLQFGAAAAAEKGDGFIAEMVERCRVGRDIVCDALEPLPRVRMARPAGAFYLFFGVEGEKDSRDLAFRLVDETGVGLAPGTAFGEGGEAYLRLCFASSHDMLRKAADRLVSALG